MYLFSFVFVCMKYHSLIFSIEIITRLSEDNKGAYHLNDGWFGGQTKNLKVYENIDFPSDLFLAFCLVSSPSHFKSAGSGRNSPSDLVYHLTVSQH